MNITEFWKLIAHIDSELLDNEDDDGAVTPVITTLSIQIPSEIKEFEEILAQLLYDIDGEKWMDGCKSSCNSDDSFLYTRCYVVARGEAYYNKVKQNPKLTPDKYKWAEAVLTIGREAMVIITGNQEIDYFPETRVSYETASNQSQWDSVYNQKI